MTKMHDNDVAVIGGGVIGLTCAYYLQKEGYRVTVIDSGDITSGTSFGNMGYVSPSHFIPIANPALASKAMRWMFNPKSPFYLKPRMDAALLRWVMLFLRHSRRRSTYGRVVPLAGLLRFSRELFTDIVADLGNHFRMREDGCLMLCKSRESMEDELMLAKQALALGFEVEVFEGKGVQALEPDVEVNVRGGVLYPIDCHVHPGEYMRSLYQCLKSRGVEFLLNTPVDRLTASQGSVDGAWSGAATIRARHFVLANGVWLPGLLQSVTAPLLIEAGKGYSVTYPSVAQNLRHPAILIERRIALTPMGSDLRLGGTMEISGINEVIMKARVAALCEGAKAYYPGLAGITEMPPVHQIWSGLRPLSPDGLPFIGRHPQFSNMIIAGGHAMLGLSLSNATGKIVEELISGKALSLPIALFAPGRFQ